MKKKKVDDIKTTHVCPLCRISHKACLTIKCGIGEKFLDFGISKPWLVKRNKELCTLFKNFKGDPSQRKHFKVVVEERMHEIYNMCFILKKQHERDLAEFAAIFFQIIDDFYEDLVKEVKLIENLDDIDNYEDIAVPVPPPVFVPGSKSVLGSAIILPDVTSSPQSPLLVNTLSNTQEEEQTTSHELTAESKNHNNELLLETPQKKRKTEDSGSEMSDEETESKPSIEPQLITHPVTEPNGGGILASSTSDSVSAHVNLKKKWLARSSNSPNNAQPAL